MALLANHLLLPDESRLMNAVFLPSFREVPTGPGSLVLQRSLIDEDDDGSLIGGALAAFTEGSVGYLAGQTYDGRAWCCVLQLFPGDEGSESIGFRASASARRATELCHVSCDLHVVSLPWTSLRAHYAAASSEDCTQWSTQELITGLVIDLATNRGMPDITTEINSSRLPRSEALQQAMLDWSAIYTGPEAH